MNIKRLTAWVCAACAAMAVTVSASCGENGPVGPRANVPFAEKDLGEIPLDGAFAHTFEVQNTGDQALSVKMESKSCSCTTSVLSAESAEPGGVVAVEVGYIPEPHARIDTRSVSVSLATNDPAKKLIVLTLTGRFIMPVEVVPAIVDLGDVPVGTAAEGVFEVLCHEYLGKVPSVTAVTTSHDGLVVEPTSSPNGSQNPTYKVLMKQPAELADELMYLEVHTDLLALPSIEVPIRFNIAYPVSTKLPRNMLVLGSLKVGGSIVKDVELVLKEGLCPKGLTAAANNNSVEAAIVETDSPGSPLLRLKVIAQDKPGLLLAHVDLNNKDGQVGRVKVKAFVRK